MQSIQKELPGLINALLQSPADRQRALVERHYAPDCRLTHALVRGAHFSSCARGRGGPK